MRSMPTPKSERLQQAPVCGHGAFRAFAHPCNSEINYRRHVPKGMLYRGRGRQGARSKPRWSKAKSGTGLVASDPHVAPPMRPTEIYSDGRATTLTKAAT